ncbi:RelE/StbE replicon stabilization toxin [Alloactinosynnema sp. L-07]|uniref:type II toxin-antitoxin system RelE family toxin n=1 Tax=Alloactinosynnema sp. L-07 TaxID=1653480 RepID=UPI00065EFD1D|nr:type II toxin-antitoxin system RelE/ParE family toxin [Alloactinosynnema sp. L-07]CRK60387.1 RelE/StbE replicon stabilization toxin [Alloactinosynnema sp. L-07]
MSEPWAIRYKPAARRALAEDLPQEVAVAAYELITGALADNRYRVGKPLGEPYEGLHSARRGTYRVLYWIDPGSHVVEIHSIRHRRDAYLY